MRVTAVTLDKAFICTREGARSGSVSLAESEVFQSFWVQRQQANCGRWPVVQEVGGCGG